jgi:hypothetical protein
MPRLISPEFLGLLCLVGLLVLALGGGLAFGLLRTRRPGSRPQAAPHAERSSELSPCRSCGQLNPSGSRFCDRCGAALADAR